MLKIIVDSTSDIYPKWIEKYDIDISPLKVVWENGETENDSRDKDDALKFYERLKASEKLPKTSQPSVEDFKELYEKAEKEGYDEILVICLSSKLSGTVNSANLAAQYTKSKVKVIDAKLASSVIGLIATEARKLYDNGMKLDEVADNLRKKIDKREFLAIFYVSDFNFLIKGGRISRVQGFIGGALKVKPCITFNEEGYMFPFKKPIGEKKAQLTLLEKAKEFIPKGSKVRICMINADNEKGVEALTNLLKEEYDIVEMESTFMGKVITTHVGPGTAGFGIQLVD
jgi:DegV family protein with EDD domain